MHNCNLSRHASRRGVFVCLTRGAITTMSRPAPLDRVERVVVLTVAIQALVAACLIAAAFLIPMDAVIGASVVLVMLTGGVLAIREWIRRQVQP